MASVVKKGDEGNDPMAGEEREENEREERDEQPGEAKRLPGPGGEGGRVALAGGGGGFFHIYKPGQGYWTRLFTVIALAGLVLSTGQFLFSQLLRARFDVPTVWAGGTVALLVAIAGGVLWYYLNKPTVVDFLVATESEMKKVNWTSQRDLIGSTKVVIVFMFLIAAILFVVDVCFGYFFHIIGVLKNSPFG